MLKRKITSTIEEKLKNYKHILIVNGARQTGKTFIIRYVGKKLFKNFVEINFTEDSLGDKIFKDVGSVSDFYTRLGVVAGNKLEKRKIH